MLVPQRIASTCHEKPLFSSVSTDFPKVGSADEECTVDDGIAPCGCPVRAAPPRPILQQYSASTLNQCKHKPLLGMSGPDLSLHVDHNKKPYAAAHTPTLIPLHQQDAVREQLDADVVMGVIEKVPIGEPSAWC